MRLWKGYREWVCKLRDYGLKTCKIDDFWELPTNMGFEKNETGKGSWRRLPTAEFVAVKLQNE